MKEPAGGSKMRHVSWMVVACLVSVPPGLAGAQGEMIARTSHSVKVDGRALEYTAQAGRVPIRPIEADEPHAHMFYVAYRVPPVDGSPRPVVFAWGGGPSAPAIGVHMGFGPRRVVDGSLVDNEMTLLPVADLVFVDPVGTGFSRPTRPEHGEEFYNVRGDAAAMAEFIRAWRALYDPEGSPIFVAGGSYGVWRAAFVAELLEKSGTRVTGVVAWSGGIQLGSDAAPREIVVALRIPGRAAAALHHGLLSPDIGPNEAAVVAAAEKWAREVYAPALARVAQLSDNEREGVARGLSRFTGYPLAKIDRGTLAVTPRDYLAGLLPGKTLDLNDMRRVRAAGGEAAAQGADRNGLRTARYLRDDLGYSTDLAYLGGLEHGYVPVTGPDYRAPGARWEYNTGTITPEVMEAARAGEGPPGTEPWLRRAMDINPRLKVLVAAGLYDSLNSCSANEDLLRRHPHLAGNFTLKCYQSGHGVARDPVSAPQFAADFRRFVVATMAAGGAASSPVSEPVSRPVMPGGNLLMSRD